MENVALTYVLGLMGVFGFLEGEAHGKSLGYKGSLASLGVAVIWPVVIGAAVVVLVCKYVARKWG